VRDETTLRILQVSTMDWLGGAEKVAWELFRSYRLNGHSSWLAVGHKRSRDPDVMMIPTKGERTWTFDGAVPFERSKNANGAADLLTRALTKVGGAIEEYCGVEPFRYPGTWQLLSLSPHRPHIVHCHNLHNEFFDLRALPWLSNEVPLILTLHDMWLLTGHCSHSIDCERWKTGCGRCPDLSLFPAIRRDATRYNWWRKRRLYDRSRLRIATPSQWLMDKVHQSVLRDAVVESRVIPNGVDLSIFKPADKQMVRASLGIAADATVLVFAANGVRSNPWKDYAALRAAVVKVAARSHDNILLLAIGDPAASEFIGRAEIRFIPQQPDSQAMARYYQAADLYVHAARADTFPLTILEALACGLPVVATAVGGTPEQVRALRGFGSQTVSNACDADRATGILAPPRDPDALAAALDMLMRDARLRGQLAVNAARDARERFDFRRQVDGYLAWYRELLHAPAARRFDMRAKAAVG
jgi:glycosyltransferase involved in cell wall biosynthesis